MMEQFEIQSAYTASIVYNRQFGLKLSPWLPIIPEYPRGFNPSMPPPIYQVAPNSIQQTDEGSNESIQENREKSNIPEITNIEVYHLNLLTWLELQRRASINASVSYKSSMFSSPDLSKFKIQHRTLFYYLELLREGCFVGRSFNTPLMEDAWSQIIYATVNYIPKLGVDISLWLPLNPMYPRNVPSVSPPMYPVAPNSMQPTNDSSNESIQKNKNSMYPTNISPSMSPPIYPVTSNSMQPTNDSSNGSTQKNKNPMYPRNISPSMSPPMYPVAPNSMQPTNDSSNESTQKNKNPMYPTNISPSMSPPNYPVASNSMQPTNDSSNESTQQYKNKKEVCQHCHREKNPPFRIVLGKIRMCNACGLSFKQRGRYRDPKFFGKETLSRKRKIKEIEST